MSRDFVTKLGFISSLRKRIFIEINFKFSYFYSLHLNCCILYLFRTNRHHGRTIFQKPFFVFFLFFSRLKCSIYTCLYFLLFLVVYSVCFMFVCVVVISYLCHCLHYVIFGPFLPCSCFASMCTCR